MAYNDELLELPYLDAVIRESMRLSPVFPRMVRQAAEDMMVPVDQPIPDWTGKLVDKIFLKKGTDVMIREWTWLHDKHRAQFFLFGNSNQFSQSISSLMG